MSSMNLWPLLFDVLIKQLSSMIISLGDIILKYQQMMYCCINTLKATMFARKSHQTGVNLDFWCKEPREISGRFQGR